jgi:nitronate monooxygenase
VSGRQGGPDPQAPAKADARELFLRHTGARLPIVGGAMYPCSNPELVAAVSEAGGIGIVQPLSLVYAHRMEFRAGLRRIRELTGRPYGLNILTEASSKIYLDRMASWLDIALDEGCRFFVTALGNPQWIVERVRDQGGIVYHDVTERKWAERALAAGVQGLICVNANAGGHAGTRGPEALYGELRDLGVPLVCAGGVGDAPGFRRMLDIGYAAVQLGTRLIATTECTAHADYKAAILRAKGSDIVHTERLTGVPVAVIRTEFVTREGTRAGWLARQLLKHPRFKHWARLWYSLRSFWRLRRGSARGVGYNDYWQAGRSVERIDSVEPVSVILKKFENVL